MTFILLLLVLLLALGVIRVDLPWVFPNILFSYNKLTGFQITTSKGGSKTP